MYRKYDSKVPGFLHNRPNGIVKHIMKRMYPEYPSSYVQNCGHRLFMVKSETSDTRYQVRLASDIQLPSCQCVDYRINRLPCKHIYAVVNLLDVGWQSLGASFNNYSLFKLDSTVVTYISSAQSSTIQNNSATKENDASKGDDHNDGAFVDQAENIKTATSPEKLQKKNYVQYRGLKARKQGLKINARAKCISTLKALNDELYTAQNTKVLSKLQSLMQEALTYARANRPDENNIPLKDKTLSPKRAKKRKVSQLSGKKPSLPLQAKRRKKKRFGVGAENREKSADLTITSNGSVKNKENKREKPVVIDLTTLENYEQSNAKAQPWLTVQGMNLTEELREILMNEKEWLSDKHVDAAQRLLKSENPGVGGLNDIVVMTHFKKTRVDLATADGRTIQCHNIGGHWVASTSVHGSVTVYESLYTGLNKTLLEQLAYLYQNVCVEEQLTVTVVLQQL